MTASMDDYISLVIEIKTFSDAKYIAKIHDIYGGIYEIEKEKEKFGLLERITSKLECIFAYKCYLEPVVDLPEYFDDLKKTFKSLKKLNSATSIAKYFNDLENLQLQCYKVVEKLMNAPPSNLYLVVKE